MCITGSNTDILYLEVDNNCNAVAGDSVRLSLKGGSIISASFWVYGVPLLGIVFGSIVGSFLADESRQFIPAVCGFAGLILGVLIGYLVDKKAKISGKYSPEIVEKIG